MNTLQDYADKYGTDKNATGHNYVSVYDPLFTPFRQDTFNFLEIGVYQCGAHRTWRAYFPNATIYGIDIQLKVIDEFKHEERMVLQEVDQGNEQQLIEYLASYISNSVGVNETTGEMGYMPFNNTLKDWLAFDIEKWTPYDLTISAMVAVIGSRAITKLIKPQRKQTTFFQKYDNRGVESRRINR